MTFKLFENKNVDAGKFEKIFAATSTLKWSESIVMDAAASLPINDTMTKPAALHGYNFFETWDIETACRHARYYAKTGIDRTDTNYGDSLLNSGLFTIATREINTYSMVQQAIEHSGFVELLCDMMGDHVYTLPSGDSSYTGEAIGIGNTSRYEFYIMTFTMMTMIYGHMRTSEDGPNGMSKDINYALKGSNLVMCDLFGLTDYSDDAKKGTDRDVKNQKAFVELKRNIDRLLSFCRFDTRDDVLEKPIDTMNGITGLSSWCTAEPLGNGRMEPDVFRIVSLLFKAYQGANKDPHGSIVKGAKWTASGVFRRFGAKVANSSARWSPWPAFYNSLYNLDIIHCDVELLHVCLFGRLLHYTFIQYGCSDVQHVS
jgi:hypothetical protein